LKLRYQRVYPQGLWARQSHLHGVPLKEIAHRINLSSRIHLLDDVHPSTNPDDSFDDRPAIRVLLMLGVTEDRPSLHLLATASCVAQQRANGRAHAPVVGGRMQVLY
jgi:hypothetical protein